MTLSVVLTSVWPVWPKNVQCIKWMWTDHRSSMDRGETWRFFYCGIFYFYSILLSLNLPSWNFSMLMWIYMLSRTSNSKVGSMGENLNFKWTSSALLKTRAVVLMKTLKFHIPCKLMQSGHYWRYIWINYRPSALQRFHDTVPPLKWSWCSLWSTKRAKCSIYKSSQGWGSEAEGEKREGRAKHSWLQVEHKVKAVQAFCASAPFGGCAPFFFPFCSCCCGLWIVFTCWFQAPSYSFRTSYLVFISAHTTAAITTKEK